MTTLTAAGAPGAPAAVAHECLANGIHLLCGFRPTAATDSPAALRAAAGGVVRALLARTRERPSSADEAAPRPLWQAVDAETARKRLHADLLPVVGQLVNGGDAGSEGDGPYLGAPPLALHDPDLLGRQAFALRLSQAAMARLARAGVSAAQAQRLAVVPEEGTLYLLASGIAVLALRLRVEQLGARSVKVAGGQPKAPLPHALLEEAVYALGHANDRDQPLRAVRAMAPRPQQTALAAGTMVVPDPAIDHALRPATDEDRVAAAQPAREGQRKAPRPLPLHLAVQQGASDAILLAEDEQELGLDDLLARLTGLPAVAWHGQADLARAAGSPLVAIGDSRHGRRFLLCAALYRANTPDDELPRLAYSLSRRYGADYLLSTDEIVADTVRPFRNICHAMATQGAAIVIRDTGASFVRDYVDAAVPATYLPLAVLNYHEYLHLRHLTQECAFMPDIAEPVHDKERLTQLRSALAAFRLYFRFSHVSDLAHHNRVHRAWREALDLDRMLQEVTLDVREAEQVLARIHQDDEEAVRASWRKWGIGGLVLGGFAAWMHLFEILVELFYPRKQWLLQALKGDGRAWGKVAADPSLHEALRLYGEAHAWEWRALAAAVALGALTAWWAQKSGTHAPGGH